MLASLRYLEFIRRELKAFLLILKPNLISSILKNKCDSVGAEHLFWEPTAFILFSSLFL